MLWALLHVVRAATATWGGRLSDRRGRSFAIVAGWLVYALTYIGFAVCSQSWQIWLLFTIYGAYYGLTEGAQKALVVDMVPKEWQGRALGVFQMSVGLAALPASAMFGLVYRQWGAPAAFSMGIACSPRNDDVAADPQVDAMNVVGLPCFRWLRRFVRCSLSLP